MMSDKNISLVGFMGTGKTSVGKVLSKKLARPVMDIDSLIEKDEKRKIADIFACEGEPHFRFLEKEKIKKICEGRGLIITAGGGAVIDEDNRKALSANGWVITLTAHPSTIYERVRRTTHRPLLKVADPLGEIMKLLEKRRSFYERSDYIIETDGKTPAQIADMIIEILNKQDV